jgi:hypothetical protein
MDNAPPFDLTKASREANPWLANFGKDRYTFRPEKYHTTAIWYHENEHRVARGGSSALLLQATIIYGVAVYTA